MFHRLVPSSFTFKDRIRWISRWKGKTEEPSLTEALDVAAAASHTHFDISLSSCCELRNSRFVSNPLELCRKSSSHVERVPLGNVAIVSLLASRSSFSFKYITDSSNIKYHVTIIRILVICFVYFTVSSGPWVFGVYLLSLMSRQHSSLSEASAENPLDDSLKDITDVAPCRKRRFRHVPAPQPEVKRPQRAQKRR